MQPYEVLYRFSSDHRRLRVELSEDAILLQSFGYRGFHYICLSRF